jgi:hypothetical protein
MIGAALALIVLGVILLFLVPLVGVIVGVLGLVLAIVLLVGFARRTPTSASR